jgi:hypothetical protein
MKWISVKDRLPPDPPVCDYQKWYLVALTPDWSMVPIRARYVRIHHPEPSKSDSFEWQAEDYEFFRNDLRLITEHVTHWMPLPELPNS